MTGFDESDRDQVQKMAGKIDAAQRTEQSKPELLLPMTDRQAIAGGRIGFEFMAAVLAGVGIGWLIDEQFATGPWGTLIGLFVGFAGGGANAWRAMNGMNQAVGWRKPAKKK